MPKVPAWASFIPNYKILDCNLITNLVISRSKVDKGQFHSNGVTPKYIFQILNTFNAKSLLINPESLVTFNYLHVVLV